MDAQLHPPPPLRSPPPLPPVPPPPPFPPPPPYPPELDGGVNCGSDGALYHCLVHHSSRVCYDVAAF